MIDNPYASSLDAKILSATPLELVNLLYQAAIEAVQAARHHLVRGEIAQRGRSIMRAVELLTELAKSLNHEKGGELSVRLAAIYDYSQRTLLDANFRQTDDGLAEVENLLKTLQDAWSNIESSRTAAPADANSGSYGASARGDYAPRVAQQWCA